jgi:hypothetical protein
VGESSSQTSGLLGIQHQRVFNREWLIRYLDLSEWKGMQVARGLVREGYVVRKGSWLNKLYSNSLIWAMRLQGRLVRREC